MRGRTKSSIIETVSAPKIRAWESLDERTQKLIAPSPVHIQRADVPQPAMMLKERDVFPSCDVKDADRAIQPGAAVISGT